MKIKQYTIERPLTKQHCFNLKEISNSLVTPIKQNKYKKINFLYYSPQYDKVNDDLDFKGYFNNSTKTKSNVTNKKMQNAPPKQEYLKPPTLIFKNESPLSRNNHSTLQIIQDQRHYRSKSMALSKSRAFSKDIKPFDIANRQIVKQMLPFTAHDIFQSQKQYRRQLISQTKKAVEQFNENNLELLTNIKEFRKEVSQRTAASENSINSFFYNSSKMDNIGNLEENSKQNLNSPQIHVIEQKKVFSDEDFFIIREIGHGAFAQVFLALQRKSGFLVTLKKINKSKIFKNSQNMSYLVTQIKIQTYVDHPNILKIYGFYVSQEEITLILEYMEEGNLYQKLKKNKSLTEQQVSQSVSEIIFALKFLHQNRIVHRDIKPQNILLNHNVRKLSDFGTAAVCIQRRATVCGTLDYSAPQIIQGHEYGSAMDNWSLGCMIFELLTGKPPFYHISRRDTIKGITQYQDGQIKYPKNLSVMAIDFISKFMRKDPQKRISLEEALKHNFILQHFDEQTRELRQKYQKHHSQV